jgi:hypothetical protein
MPNPVAIIGKYRKGSTALFATHVTSVSNCELMMGLEINRFWQIRNNSIGMVILNTEILTYLILSYGGTMRTWTYPSRDLIDDVLCGSSSTGTDMRRGTC